VETALGTTVVGIEADISGVAAKGSDTSTDLFPIPLETEFQRSLDWLSTVRGRIGFLPTRDLLVFASGGVAFARIEQSLTFSNLSDQGVVFQPGAPFQLACEAASVCLAGSSSTISVGWTAGAGFEYAVASQVSLKAEYLFVGLGSQSVTPRATSGVQDPQIARATDFDVHVVRAGLNVKF